MCIRDRSNTKTYCFYQPYLDKLSISQTHEMFSMYSKKSSLNGNLLLQPIGLTGNGIMKLDLAEVSSNFFSFNSTWFKADTANLNVFDNNNSIAFNAQNLRANIDLSDREGVFYSNGSGSYVTFPASEYISYIDKLKWEMDKEQLTFGEKEFKKRELVVTTDEQYPQSVLIEFVQDKCDLLNNFKVGDKVRMLDGKSVGSIDAIEKQKAIVNYGLFTTQVSLDQLEIAN